MAPQKTCWKYIFSVLIKFTLINSLVFNLKKISFKRTREESLQSQITISSSLDRLQNIRRTKFWISDSFVYATSQNLFNIMANWLKNLSTKSRKYDTLKTLIFEIINETNRVLMKTKLVWLIYRCCIDGYL